MVKADSLPRWDQNGAVRLTPRSVSLDSRTMVNRNKRKVKKANHGKRPANSNRRKARNRAEKKNG